MNNMDLNSLSYIRKTNESIQSDVFINFINLLDIEYKIGSFGNDADLLSEAVISWCEDFIAQTHIKALGINDLQSTAKIYKYYDLLSSVFIAYRDDILSNANITDQILLNIMYKLIQAPIHELNLLTIQDAYIRESRPTINYGTLQTLVSGKLIEGQYQTLLEFNSQAFNNLRNVDILSANLTLTLSSNFDPEYTYYIYEVVESWSESSITWANFSQLERKLISTFKCDSSTVSIDLLQYLRELQSKYSNKVNLLIVGDSSNEFVTYYQSRETPEESTRPQIKIRYQDKSWNGFVDNTSITNYATIRSLNARDLHSKINIFNQIDLESSVKIQRDKLLDTQSDANIYHMLEILGTVEVKNFHMFLNASATSRHSNELSINSNSIIYIPTELKSIAYIRRSSYIDKLSYAKSRYSRYTDIDSTAYIKQQAEFPGTSIINRNGLYDRLGFISVAYGNNLISNAVVRSLAITETTNLQSRSIIRQLDKLDINSLINVVESIGLDSTAILKAIRSYDTLSTAFARLTNFNGLDSTAIIRQFDVSELDSVSYLFGGEISDCNSSVQVKRFLADYIISVATIQTNARQWVSNIHGKDVFTFEDRKLPRVWKRENFIYD